MTEKGAGGADDDSSAGPEVIAGLVAAPGAAADLAAVLIDELTLELARRLPGVRWRLELVTDDLVSPPAEDTEIVDAARRLLLARGWDLVVCLTDLPLRVSRRPVVAHASPVHGVALVSVPALGAVALRRRSRDVVLRLIDQLLGEPDGETAGPGDSTGRVRRLTRRLRELGSDANPADGSVRFTARVLSGNLRLLVGMVRANRPWQLAARLSRALTAAIAAGVFALITADIWRLADALGGLRLTVIAAGSVAAIAAALIIGAGLWERTRHRRAREQVVLFNLATAATVLIGVLAFYAALFVLALLGSLLLVVPGLLTAGLGHPAGPGDYAELAWLTSSLATVGGALGAGLETDDAVRQAAYTHRASQPTEPADPDHPDDPIVR